MIHLLALVALAVVAWGLRGRIAALCEIVLATLLALWFMNWR